MRMRHIQCSMCGQYFDPDQHLACQACPMRSGCDLVCCPMCGYQTINPGRSRMVQLGRFLASLKSTPKPPRFHGEGMTLVDAPPGCRVEVIGFAEEFPADRQAYLQAYGLVLNYCVQVLQQKPVTILRVDQIELALEGDLARGIFVRMSPPKDDDKLSQQFV